jgi:hypothetical protein
MRNFWCTEWHWDRRLSEYFIFCCELPVHQLTNFIFILLPSTLHSLDNEARLNKPLERGKGKERKGKERKGKERERDPENMKKR